MKYLDANIFLRYITEPVTDIDRSRQEACIAFFESVDSGDFTVTTSESVIDEIFYVLCSTRQYGLGHEDAVSRLAPVLSMHGFHLPRRRLFIEAIQLFAAHAFLDFADAMSATISRVQGDDLLSYDSDFDRLPGVNRSEP